MVDKMMKYSFILMNEETEGFLSMLQELGIVDITRSTKPIDEKSVGMFDQASAAKRIIAKLEGIDYTKSADKKAIMNAYKNAVLSDDLVSGAQNALNTLSELEANATVIEKELKSRLPWGEFDNEGISKLEKAGYTVRYYSVNKKKFSADWSELYPLEIISEDKNTVWFVTVAPAGEEYSFPADAMEKPAASWKESAKALEAVNAEIASTKGLLLKYKDAIPQIENSYRKSVSDLDFYLAKASSESAAESRLSVLTGFVPADKSEEILQALEKSGVLYIEEEATEEDNPPVKLKNNRFVKMFESITGMYGMPVYGEYDPTPVVSIFFLLFFAMCMGDAGYGLILILFGIAVTKNWVNIDMFKGIGPLITTLGVATLVVGTILGTAFGVNLYEASWVPQILKDCMITGEVMGYPAQMVLAIGIGVFHLCLAMTIKAVGYTKRFGFKQNIATWGWLILILGGIAIAALALIGVLNSDITKWAVITLGIVSALGIFVFNTPGRNPLVNIGAGLWDTYNMITGILGDVLSYIRLYALGLAGGMLGNAFNNLGTMVLGDGGINWVFFILILVIGHVINVLMSCLGAFVHPLRLNFVEYFKNSGYEGKGKAYNPLTK